MAEQLPYHPIANIFPLLDGIAFRDLVEDIRVHGLQEPIIIFEGAILDGRNRARACCAAQVPACYKTYDGRDPIAFVVSANLHRRHLDVSQRAMIAASISEKRSGGRRGPSQKLGGKIVKRFRPEQYKPAPVHTKVSMSQAASLLNVSPGSVTAARKVIKSGTPELVRSVHKGNISASAAAVVATFKQEQQRNILASGPKAISVLAREDKLARHKNPRIGGPTIYDAFKIGDGRSIGSIRFGECGSLELLMTVTAFVLREIRMHIANANHSARIRDVVTDQWLSETIDRIWSEVESSSQKIGMICHAWP